MLVSAVQRSESLICINISPYPLPLEPPSHPSKLSQSWSPCAMQQLPTSHPFYIWQCIYVNATLSLRPSFPFPPCPQVHSLHLHLYSCPATRFIDTIFLKIPYICVSIWYCFSLSDLLHSVWQTLGQSTSLQITQFRSFLWLSNIPLYICATSSLSIHLLTDT